MQNHLGKDACEAMIVGALLMKQDGYRKEKSTNAIRQTDRDLGHRDTKTSLQHCGLQAEVLVKNKVFKSDAVMHFVRN
ncbi:hypothetical protein ACTXT7_006216 [Hymenolepis weldensis]